MSGIWSGEARKRARDRAFREHADKVLTSPGEALGLEQYMQRLRMRKIQVAGRVEVTNNGPLEIHDVEITKIDLGEMAILPLDGAK